MLNEKGQCCGRKPLLYKTDTPQTKAPFLFCSRCNRAYDATTKQQVENWAFKKQPDGSFWKR